MDTPRVEIFRGEDLHWTYRFITDAGEEEPNPPLHGVRRGGPMSAVRQAMDAHPGVAVVILPTEG